MDLSSSFSDYFPHTEDDIKKMLEGIGVTGIDELFNDIPSSIRDKAQLCLPQALPEWELDKVMRSLAAKNSTVKSHLCFVGAGAYEHFIPATIDALASRGEFLTAYTPYQPEMSQGLLRTLYEFQQMVSQLVGLPAVNSSVYDGATALAESAWMMSSATKKHKILVANSILPNWVEVIETYAKGRGLICRTVPANAVTGQIDEEALAIELTKGGIAGLLVQSPNAFGVLENIGGIAALCQSNATLLSVSCNPISLGIIEPPGYLGADIVTFEGQALGIHLSGGGPYFGTIACKKEYERYLPGRIVGKVVDLHGNDAYALIKEDREQHIAREKATSHICSNQALNVLRAAVYLMTLGSKGLGQLALLNATRARYLAQRLNTLGKISFATSGPYFNEFALRVDADVGTLQRRMYERGYFMGYHFPQNQLFGTNLITLAVTEMRNVDEIDNFVRDLADELHKL